MLIVSYEKYPIRFFLLYIDLGSVPQIGKIVKKK